MRPIARALAFAVVCFAGVALAGACGSSETRDTFTRPQDAGVDADAAREGSAPEPDAGTVDPTIGGPCVDDAQCDDGIACTFEACDPALKRCRTTPDDAQCDNGIYCDGREVCVLHRGCTPGGVVACDDGDACTLDKCVEALKACDRAPRDADGDGDPDDHCAPTHDCNDNDPTVASTAREVCGNGKDDNCNGQIDETPCSTPVGDTCAAPIALGGSATYSVSTVGATKSFATTCSVATPASARDIVAAITIPAGGSTKDLDVWATTPNSEVSLAVFDACTTTGTELACGSAPLANTMRARARDLTPGATYFIVVTTQTESDVELKVRLLDAAPKATNETCATAAPIVPETPMPVSIFDATKDLATACAAGGGSGSTLGELTYALTLSAAADVRAFASVTAGSGAPVLGLRNSACTAAADELHCRTLVSLTSPPLFARALPAGRYVLTVSATSPIDANVLVKLSPPTVAPADQSCVAPPPAQINATMPVDLTNREDALKDACLVGWPNAAFDLPLAVASDVLLVGRFPQTGVGAVSLTGPTCTVDDRLACTSSFTPARTGKRNVAAGSYRVVVTDTISEDASLTTLVRPTVAPTVVTGSDACADANDITPTGAYLTGDTTGHVPDFTAGCDASGQAPGGASDQIFRLVLTERKRVVMSMAGSSFATVLDVRKGAACPGDAIAGGCFVGFSGARSFLDQVLDAGTYWVVVDGYAGAKGAWNLDVHVVPPP